MRLRLPSLGARLGYVRFLVESSIGTLEIQLFEDGWAGIDLASHRRGAPSVEDRIRNSDDMTRALISLGLPEVESNELAVELWRELTEDERQARSQLRGLGESRRASERRD